MTGRKENGIKHCYRADKGNTLLEPSLKVLFIKFGWGATFKSQRLGVKCRKCKWLPSLEKAYYLSFYTTWEAMFGVKNRVFKVKEFIYVGFKLIHIQKCSFFGHACQPSWISMIWINFKSTQMDSLTSNLLILTLIMTL